MRARAGRETRRRETTTTMLRVLHQRCGAEARRARRRGGMPAAWMRRSVGRVTGGGEPADMPVVTGLGACARRPLPTDGRSRLDDGQLLGQEFSIINYLDKHSRSLRRHERRPSHAHTAAPVLGPRAVTHGVAATTDPSVDVSSTASVAAPTGRVPGLRGAFIIASTPCSCVGIGDQHSGMVRAAHASPDHGVCGVRGPGLVTLLLLRVLR